MMISRHTKTFDRRKKIIGQTALEYALIIIVVVSALGAMSVYVQRSVQANLKMVEDQVNARAK